AGDLRGSSTTPPPTNAANKQEKPQGVEPWWVKPDQPWWAQGTQREPQQAVPVSVQPPPPTPISVAQPLPTPPPPAALPSVPQAPTVPAAARSPLAAYRHYMLLGSIIAACTLLICVSAAVAVVCFKGDGDTDKLNVAQTLDKKEPTPPAAARDPAPAPDML